MTDTARVRLLQRGEALIRANLNLRVFAPLFLLALATTWYGLFYSVDRFGALTGGLAFPDMQPRLTVDALFAQIGAYSPETARFYLGWVVFDYAWPFLTFTTMLFISGWLCSVRPDSKIRFTWLIASAYLTVLMDWAENTGFIALVLALPAEPRWLASVTLGFHAAKLLFNMVFNALFWLLLILVIVAGIGRRFSARAAGANPALSGTNRHDSGNPDG